MVQKCLGRGYKPRPAKGLDQDPHKDAKKLAQLAPLWNAYWDYLAQQPTFSSELRAFRWQLEELRVSLFAPELKTAYPVSVQRLEKIWQTLQLKWTI
jgi:ATP-dependent helicase HrpA